MAGTTLGRQLTEEHKLAQISLAARYYAASKLLLGQLDPARLDATLPTWLALQVTLTRRFHADGVAEAASYLAEFRQAETSRAQAADMPIITPDFDVTGVAERMVVLSPMAKARTAGGMSPRDAVEQVFWQLAPAWSRVGVQAGGRDLIDRSTLANPHSEGWRRVSDGHPCTWCGMLVTRAFLGDLYRTAATAGEGRHYHDRCGCTVEEVFGGLRPNASEQRLIDLYTASHEPGMTASQTTAAMRRNGEGVVNDAVAPATKVGGQGGGGRKKPPRGFGEPPDPSDEDAWDRYWAARQAQLATPTHGEVLKAHEVEFLERFEALGHTADWIPVDRAHSLPTNDFVWTSLDGGTASELKTTGAKYSKIKDRIHEAVVKAAAQGVTKDVFVIDLDMKGLPEKLRNQLAQYNQRTQIAPIRRLFVMHSNGVLEEIDLK